MPGMGKLFRNYFVFANLLPRSFEAAVIYRLFSHFFPGPRGPIPGLGHPWAYLRENWNQSNYSVMLLRFPAAYPYRLYNKYPAPRKVHHWFKTRINVRLLITSDAEVTPTSPAYPKCKINQVRFRFRGRFRAPSSHRPPPVIYLSINSNYQPHPYLSLPAYTTRPAQSDTPALLTRHTMHSSQNGGQIFVM